MGFEDLAQAAAAPVRDVLGDFVEYRASGGVEWLPFTAVFDISPETIDPDLGVPVRSQDPVATFADSDLEEGGVTLQHGDSLRRSGVEYTIVDVAPDGGGMTTVRLQLPGGSL